jgi:hypothetical protein
VSPNGRTPLEFLLEYLVSLNYPYDLHNDSSVWERGEFGIMSKLDYNFQMLLVVVCILLGVAGIGGIAALIAFLTLIT